MIEKVNLDFRELTPFKKKIEKIVCHHPAHPSWDIYEIHNYHKAKGWSGIGYNYFITFDGHIQEARGRNIGAHCLDGWNYKSLGVSFQGDFTYQKMTDEQVKAGATLIASLLKNEGLQINDVVGHNDLWHTICPGPNFRMNDLKNEILTILNPPKKESVSMFEFAVVINSFNDYPAAEMLANKLNAPIFTRFVALKLQVAKNVYVCGGDPEGIKGNIINLSGANRYETAQNIGKFLKKI